MPAPHRDDRALDAVRWAQLQADVMDAAKLLATANGVDPTQLLARSKADEMVAQTGELMRAARAAIQDRLEEARSEHVRRQVEERRLKQLEGFYAQLQREMDLLEADRAKLTAGLHACDAAHVQPQPVVGFLRRLARITIAALAGAVFAGPLAGPVVTQVLTDPILGKAFEGFMGGFAGALVSEVGESRAVSQENRRRLDERGRRDERRCTFCDVHHER